MVTKREAKLRNQRREAEAIVKKLPQEVQRLFNKELESHSVEGRNLLEYYWQRGKAAEQISSHRSVREDPQIKRPVELMAAYVGVDKSVYYKSKLFFEMYPTKEQLNGLINMTKAAERPFSWGHMRVIVLVPPAKTGDPFKPRYDLIDQTLKQGLSMEELFEVITQKYLQQALNDGDQVAADRLISRSLSAIRSVSTRGAKKILESMDNLIKVYADDGPAADDMERILEVENGLRALSEKAAEAAATLAQRREDFAESEKATKKKKVHS